VRGIFDGDGKSSGQLGVIPGPVGGLWRATHQLVHRSACDGGLSQRSHWR
jgi:hypothetical protein